MVGQDPLVLLNPGVQYREQIKIYQQSLKPGAPQHKKSD